MKLSSTLRAAAVFSAAGSLFLSQAAAASCAAPASTAPFEISVTQSWTAEQVNDGDIGGCLLQAQTADGQKITAYTSYDFICALKPEEKITVAPSYACCDTGEQGDYVCGIKPRVPLQVVGQTSLTIAPAVHDARAIADLFAHGLAGKLRDASAFTKLQDYLADPNFSEAVKKQLPALEKALDDGSLKDGYVRAQVAALLLAAMPESPKADGWRLLRFTGEIDYALTPVQKSLAQELAAKPDAATTFMPVLIDRLRRANDDDRAFLLSLAANMGAAARPFANDLADALGSDLAELPDAAIDVTSGDAVEQARRTAEQKALAIKRADIATRRVQLLPLLAKIACDGAQPVTVGKTYPIQLDCK